MPYVLLLSWSASDGFVNTLSMLYRRSIGAAHEATIYGVVFGEDEDEGAGDNTGGEAAAADEDHGAEQEPPVDVTSGDLHVQPARVPRAAGRFYRSLSPDLSSDAEAEEQARVENNIISPTPAQRTNEPGTLLDLFFCKNRMSSLISSSFFSSFT